MIDLVLVKKDMLRYVQDVRAVRGMGRGLSDHYVVLRKGQLVGAWIRRIRSEKLREHRYREGYARSLERKGVDWDGENNFEYMWEQVKRAVEESSREVCGSVREGGKNKKSAWWNDEETVAVTRKEAAWKEVLVASNEESKERCMEACTEEKRGVKRRIIHIKKKVNKQFGRKLNVYMHENRKLFWKEMSNAKGGKVESCSKIKDENGW